MSDEIKIPEDVLARIKEEALVWHRQKDEDWADHVAIGVARWMRGECAITARQCAIQLDVPGNGVKWVEEQINKVGSAR